MRACARFDAARVAAAIAIGRRPIRRAARPRPSRHDHRPGTGHERATRASVALEGKDLEHAAHEYFLRSEQIPTRVRLAVAEELRAESTAPATAGAPAACCCSSCRKSPERARQPDLDPGDVPEGWSSTPQPEDDAWVEGRSLVATVEDVELIDPDVSAEQLLYRLFHERGVRVFRSGDLHAECSCSRAGVERMLRSFPQDDRDHMVENGEDHRDLRVLQLDLRVRAHGRASEPRARAHAGMPGKRRAEAQLIVRSRCGVSSEKAGNIDVERLAGRGHHAVGAGHETGRRRQRHAAGVFEILARLEHRFLADHAGAAHLLQASLGVGDAPMAGLELHRLASRDW